MHLQLAHKEIKHQKTDGKYYQPKWNKVDVYMRKNAPATALLTEWLS